MTDSPQGRSFPNGFPQSSMEEPMRHPLSNIAEESTVPPEAPEPMQRDYSNSGTEPNIPDTDASEVPVERRRPFSELRPSTPGAAADATHSGVSTTPLLSNPNDRKPRTPSLHERRFNRMQEHEGHIDEGETPPFAPTVGGSPKTTTTTPRSKRRSGYFRAPGDDSATNNDEGWDNESQSSTTSSADDWNPHSEHGNQQHRYRGQQDYGWHHRQNGERDFRPQVSPAPSSSSTTTTDRRPEFTVPPNLYRPATFGGGTANNPLGAPLLYGPNRGVPMAPLGPPARFASGGFRNGAPANASAFTFHQTDTSILLEQQLKKMQEFFQTIPGMMGGGTSPSYVTNGPVYAPNPPHSLSRSNSMPIGVGNSYMGNSRGSVGGVDQASSIISGGGNSYPWPTLHQQMSHPQLFGSMPTPPEMPHRSFSTETPWQSNIGPGIMRNDVPTPMQMPRSSPVAVTSAQEQNYQNQMSGMMQGWHPGMHAGAFGPQPNTPGSQNGMMMHGGHGGHGRATVPPPAWMAAMQQGDGQWVGGTPTGMPMGMGMGMQGMQWSGRYSA